MTREDFIACAKAEQKRLRLFLLGLCADPDLADDLAQDTLMKAYLASEAFVPRFSFSTWLLKIAYNNFLDYSRLYGVRCRGSLDSLVDRQDNEASADASFRFQRLYQALDKLTEKERSAVMLFYIYGFSAKEISGIVGESSATVRKRLQRAREHLENELINDENNERQ